MSARHGTLVNDIRWSAHHLGPVAALALAALACGMETVELRAIRGAGGDALAETGPSSAGASEEPPEPPAPPSAPIAAPGEASETPNLDFNRPLPDAGIDLSPLPPQLTGCRAVDFLFVVDNSLSMTDEQDNLVQSFGGFMQVVQSTLDAQDYHIMAIDTDDRGIGIGGSPVGPFVSPASCNGAFGAGRNQSVVGQECGVDGGAAFMTVAQDNLADTFACVARVGTFGDIAEQPMTALLSAVTPPLAASGGCNEGFLRDEAILVVTFITDEDDTRSPGDPSDWRERLLQAKGGDESALVVLGLVGDSNLVDPLMGGPCLPPAAAPAPRLQQFVDSLRHGSLGSVCADDYSPFLARAVGEIENACDTFTAPVR
jgi:hypothetical protein